MPKIAMEPRQEDVDFRDLLVFRSQLQSALAEFQRLFVRPQISLNPGQLTIGPRCALCEIKPLNQAISAFFQTP